MLVLVVVLVILALANVLVLETDATFELVLIDPTAGTPAVVVTVLTVPAGLITTPLGFGFAVVGFGIIATAPVAGSVLITAPAKSIVLPLSHKSFHLWLGLPKL